VAKNVIADATSYRPFPSLVAFSEALSNVCVGAFGVKGASGSEKNFAGTLEKLYLLSSNSWTDVSITGDYDGVAGDRWAFAVFGNRVIATNYKNNPQYYTIGSSTDFADLTTSFKAKHVAVVREHVMFANLDESGTAKRNKVWWSGINDPTTYTPSATTLADNQEIYGESDLGEITGLVGGENATVFFEYGIHKGTYVGGQYIFTFDQIVFNAGCLVGGSISSHGNMIFYLGPDGFYMLNGTTLMPIGKNKVDKWFYSDFDQSLDYLVTSVIDPINSLYIVSYPGAGNNGKCNKMLCYNWFSQKWTTIETENVEFLFAALTNSVATDDSGLDTLYGGMDDGPYADVSVDSRIFIGGKRQLAAINGSHQLSYFNGADMTATIETAEQQIFAGKRALVRNVTTHVTGEASSITVKAGVRDVPQEAVSYSDPSTVNSYGEANMLSNARYHRAQVTITGGFEQAYGIDVDAVQVGKY
jgi:hypothetical protein